MGSSAGTGLEVRLLGPVRVLRNEIEVSLPRSRKVRTLLALLALARSPVSRSRLCDLLWDAPNDPRGELRWCLSKLRSVLDEPGHRRVTTVAQATVQLDLTGCKVDVLELDRMVETGLAAASTQQLAEVCERVAGDLLDGMPVDGVALTGWLVAQRQHYRAAHIAVLRELALRAPSGSDEALRQLQSWLERAPFDTEAHERMLDALVKHSRLQDAETHLTSTIRAFEQEGIDWAPLRDAWHTARQAAAARAPATSRQSAPALALPPARRGSVVVIPFAEGTPGAGPMAAGLTDDIITRLAKLRVLFVIARGTSYALRDRGVTAQEAGRILNAEYVVSGVVRRHAERISVLVELSHTQSARIVWTEQIDGALGDTFSVLDSIVVRIVAGISDEIEREESKRALLKQPSSLDAWEAYHRGLWHMYKFNSQDNAAGARFFRDALALDPMFARAYAGLSFTHFQNVFLGLTPDREQQMTLALETAGRSLDADDRDPAAHWAMGRALWLRGEQDESLAQFERSVELSPNFALGHYMLGFVHAQSGDPASAITAADFSRELSPFDPLQFGMLATRALAHLRLGDRDAACASAIKAARRPNAHAHILAIAALSLALAHRREQARELVANIRASRPDYTVEDLLRAFRFVPDAVKLFRDGAKRIGFD